MRKHSSWAAFLAAAAFLGPIEVVPAATHHDSAAPEASALATGARVADWQLSHLDHFDYIPATAFRRDTEAPRCLIQLFGELLTGAHPSLREEAFHFERQLREVFLQELPNRNCGGAGRHLLNIF